MKSVNTRIYAKVRNVPDNAQKTIKGGRLKGKTDINPMWRIKTLTELFGPCGIGWWYEITDKHIESDDVTNQKAAFVDILLYYVDPDSGKTSKGIPGTGGASFVSSEEKGSYLSDECYKMALTDAISVSCKALGIGADVYWDADRSKYEQTTTPPPNPRHPLVCDVCGGPIKGAKTADGRIVSSQEWADTYGRCIKCLREGQQS